MIHRNKFSAPKLGRLCNQIALPDLEVEEPIFGTEGRGQIDVHSVGLDLKKHILCCSGSSRMGISCRREFSALKIGGLHPRMDLLDFKSEKGHVWYRGRGRPLRHKNDGGSDAKKDISECSSAESMRFNCRNEFRVLKIGELCTPLALLDSERGRIEFRCHLRDERKFCPSGPEKPLFLLPLRLEDEKKSHNVVQRPQCRGMRPGAAPTDL